MLAPFARLLSDRAEGQAIGAFTAYDLEGATAVLRAARAAGAGVIILVGMRSFTAPDGPLLLSALVAAAARADVAACVQLDHCDDLEVIAAALEAGAGAVMADASKRPYEDNVAFVAEAVALAARHGASVEAELGAITGDEDVARAVAAGALTDPDQAVDFIGRTRADCLAVSIGNVHGIYREPPRLDLDRLAEIHRRCPTPLSLHGASGIPDATVSDAIGRGIAKINVNTELRAAYLEATAVTIARTVDGSRLADLHDAQVSAVEAVVAAKLAAFGEGGS